jgi:hypothetical protein
LQGLLPRVKTALSSGEPELSELTGAKGVVAS